jgi:hypothetical protein
MTNAEIIAATTCHDPERFRYEVEAQPKKAGAMTYWPNKETQCDIWSTRAFYYNSHGKNIAAFKLKAWK